MFFQLKNLILFSMLKKGLSRKELVQLMQHPWHWLQITNLKGLLEEEVGTTIKESKEVEVKEISVVVVTVSIPQMEISTPPSLSTISLNLVKQGLQDFSKDFRDKHTYHNARYVRRMDIWLLIATTGWTLLFKATMLHQNLLQWWLILLRFIKLMASL